MGNNLAAGQYRYLALEVTIFALYLINLTTMVANHCKSFGIHLHTDFNLDSDQKEPFSGFWIPNNVTGIEFKGATKLFMHKHAP